MSTQPFDLPISLQHVMPRNVIKHTQGVSHINLLLKQQQLALHATFESVFLPRNNA